MNDAFEMQDFTGVLYIRNTQTGQLCRFNVQFDKAQNLDNPPTIWQFQVTTTTPLKVVQTAQVKD